MESDVSVEMTMVRFHQMLNVKFLALEANWNTVGDIILWTALLSTSFIQVDESLLELDTATIAICDFGTGDHNLLPD